MPKIIMLKGLPGSGKTTWAKEFVKLNPGWIRVNKDDIRSMFGVEFSKENESRVLDTQNMIIELAIAEGKSVVVDNTGYAPQHEEFIKSICKVSEYGVHYEVKEFCTPLEECILNDAKRPHPVGPKVIKKMWRQFVYRKPDRPEWVEGAKTITICDLDGTLAIHRGRSPYDVEKCDTDMLNTTVANLILERHVIFVTGREEIYRTLTSNWLLSKVATVGMALYMRPTGDTREDSIVKQEIYEREIKGKYNVEFVLDDRNRVVDMWRRQGLTCLQVAEGDF